MAVSAFCAAAFFASGCSSELNISEDSFDGSITFGGDSLAVPVGSTDKIGIGDFLNVDTVDMIYVDENGKYYLEVSSSFGDTIMVSDYTDRMAVDGIDRQSPDRDFDVPGNLASSSSGQIVADFDYEDEFTYLFSLEEARDSGLISVRSVWLDESYLVPHVNVSSDKELPASLRLSLQLEVPDKYAFEESPTVDGGLITFEGPVQTDGSVLFQPLQMDSIYLDLKEGDSFEFLDTFYVRKLSVMVDAEDADMLAGSHLHVTNRVTAGGEDGMLHPSSFYGKVDYDISAIEELTELSDIPGYLKAEDVCLDFTSPSARVMLSSNAGIPLIADAVIGTTYSASSEDGSLPLTLAVPSSDDADVMNTLNYWVSDEQPADMPSDYTWLQADLRDLLSRVPDAFSYSIKPYVDLSSEEDHFIDCLAEYVIDGEVVFNLPFAFGEKLYLPVRDTLYDMPEAISSVISMANIEINGEIRSTFPVAFDVSAYFLDSQNRPLDINVSSQHVASAGADGTMSVSPLTLSVDRTEQEMDIAAIVLQFELRAGQVPGEQLSEDSWLQADVSLGIPGGLTFELMDNE